MEKLQSFLSGMFSVYSFPGLLSESKPPRILDMSGLFQKFHRSDADAIASDWQKVGNDLQNAMNRYVSQESFQDLVSP